jgi:hypothetical protein
MKCEPWMRVFYALCILAALFECDVDAHTLDLTTARVTLRDNHVDMTVEIDSVQMVLRYASTSAAKTPTTLATATEEELTDWVSAARKAASNDTRLQINGTAVELALLAFPTPSEVRFVAAQASASAHPHAEMSVLRFDTSQALANIQTVSVSFSSDFGRVLCTFVQPTTMLTEPGSKASFGVLETPRLAAAEPSKSANTWLAVLAVVLAAVAIALQARPTRRRSTS